jgi:hypothetical protein
MPPGRTGLVAATDQSDGGWIRICDLGERFDAPPREAWSWRPGGVDAWGRPTDARLRRHPVWGDVLVAADSFGAIVVAGADGRPRWSVDAGAPANPHAAELAGGLVVAAMSTGGLLRTFDPARGEEWEPVSLPGAHGVVWDEGRETLWALGYADLVALRPATVHGAWETVASFPLPTLDGHDLVAVDAGLALWATTTSAVHRFDVVRGIWTDTGIPGLDRPRVKSIDQDPVSGTISLTVPDAGRDPEWATSSIALLGPGAVETAVAFPGTQLYKARHWRAR